MSDTLTHSSRARRASGWVAVFSLVTASWLLNGASTAFAQQSELGLDGLLPGFVPAEIDEEAWFRLGDDSSDFAQASYEDVVGLYNVSGKSVSDQRAAIGNLRDRLELLSERAAQTDDPSERAAIHSLAGPLARRVDVAEAVLNSLEQPVTGEPISQLEKAKIAVRRDIAAARKKLDSITGGSAWVDYLQLDAAESALSGEFDVEPIETLSNRLSVDNSQNDAQAAFMNKAVLRELKASAERLTAAAAVPAAPKNDAEENDGQSALRDALGDFIQATEDYENEINSTTGQALHDAIERVDELSPAAADSLADVVKSNYMASNVHAVVGEEFLRKLIRTNRVDSGRVVDYVAGANVRGNQTTNSRTGISLIPSRGKARFAITLDGTVNSRTNGYTKQATIASVGSHDFHARKTLTFDGNGISFGAASIDVKPSVRNVGARTRFDWLLGGIARRQALRTANSRRGIALGHAKMRVRQRVLPPFEDGVRDSFSDFGNVTDRLADAGLRQTRTYVESTSSEVLLSDRIVDADGPVVGGFRSPTPATSSSEITFRLHESVLTASAANWDVAGQELTSDEFAGKLEEWLEGLLGREVSLSDNEPPTPSDASEESDPSVYVFNDTNPVSFRIQNGSVELILRVGIVQEDGDIPPQLVTVPLTPKVEGETLMIERGDVSVVPLPGQQAQIARARVMIKKIEDTIEPSERSAALTVDRDNASDVKVYVTEIDATDGWLTVTAR
ncbi:hypothetical protein [Stratiformator vulcanicus]|uniref:Uncharacterized protein n=1 Tax=Stratiformator vulcanicus TaxID=2527980 RepID=A0A517QZT1_9PLAN|nr:hypothetical protein [Stratiformator vulcanicus]QDT37060.1 hypothetical protein Pan189_14260 [Stratiformator vulcanicus]